MTVMSRLLRLLVLLAAVKIAALAISVSLVNLPYAAEPQAQRSPQGGSKAKAAATPMGRCMAAWDPATQMSKREWRDTCERTVKEYPSLYSKPF